MTRQPQHAQVSGDRIARALLALLLPAWLAACERPPDPLLPGATAPSFTLKRVGDDSFVSLSDARGRIVLVNFWATWCPPCEAEMPAMERLYRGLRGEGFELLAISVDDSLEAVEAFRDKHELTFPILHDPSKAVATAYQTFKFPESLLIDADGVVVGRFIGEKDWDSPLYVARIRDLLREDGAP
ncbi:MAG: TlpA family protein disulfide reductase [Deltaproteobacteria bacterium]|nr:MAG: TlpA family protein disulfide reductase [Deltaproteobacteria bacterium]